MIELDMIELYDNSFGFLISHFITSHIYHSLLDFGSPIQYYLISQHRSTSTQQINKQTPFTTVHNHLLPHHSILQVLWYRLPQR